MKHVKKGCLSRPTDSIRSDGSRIEGSHKGWNSLQRSFPSGIEMMAALSHDFVHRQNVRTGMRQGITSDFLSLTKGSHHIQLVHHCGVVWNQELLKYKGKKSLDQCPLLPAIETNKKFGVVQSNFTDTFGGLLKFEDEEDDIDLLGLLEQDTEDLAATTHIDIQVDDPDSSLKPPLCLSEAPLLPVEENSLSLTETRDVKMEQMESRASGHNEVKESLTVVVRNSVSFFEFSIIRFGFLTRTSP